MRKDVKDFLDKGGIHRMGLSTGRMVLFLLYSAIPSVSIRYMTVCALARWGGVADGLTPATQRYGQGDRQIRICMRADRLVKRKPRFYKQPISAGAKSCLAAC